MTHQKSTDVGGGFATAAGTPVRVSYAALDRARRCFEEQEHSIGVHTDSFVSQTTPSGASAISRRGCGSNQFNQEKLSSLPKQQQAESTIRIPTGRTALGVQNVTPINLLSPYVTSWKICGVVTSKGDIQEKKNVRGGNLLILNFEIADGSGDKDTIRVTAYNDEAEKFVNAIQKNMMYYLSGGKISPSDKRFNSTSQDYELKVTKETEIMPCNDRQAINTPRIRFNLVKLDQLGKYIDKFIDVMGVVESLDEVSSITSNKTNNHFDKRDLRIVDDTGTLVTVTLWNDVARAFSTNSVAHPTIGFKGIKVKEFQGVSLSAGGSTKIELNPDCDEAFVLAEWYDANGATLQPVHLSRPPMAADLTDLRLIEIANALKSEVIADERRTYFHIKAMVSAVVDDNALYRACSESACKKKVVEIDGRYQCEKCQKLSDTYKYIMLFRIEVCDLSGSHWLTVFEDAGAKLLNITSEELGRNYDTDPHAFKAVFDSIRCKSFVFKIRTKTDTYNVGSGVNSDKQGYF